MRSPRRPHDNYHDMRHQAIGQIMKHKKSCGSARRVAATTLTGALLLAPLAGCGTDPLPPRQSFGTAALDETSMPPWSAPTDVPARVDNAGLDLGPMGMEEHYHPNLAIIIAGEQVPLPGNIGVDASTGAMSAVHTHEGDGTIHIEAGVPGEIFTLGQLFTQWGLKLTATQIGGVKAEPGETITVTSNGTPVEGDPNDLRLEPEQRIVLELP